VNTTVSDVETRLVESSGGHPIMFTWLNKINYRGEK